MLDASQELLALCRDCSSSEEISISQIREIHRFKDLDRSEGDTSAWADGVAYFSQLHKKSS